MSNTTIYYDMDCSGEDLLRAVQDSHTHNDLYETLMFLDLAHKGVIPVNTMYDNIDKFPVWTFSAVWNKDIIVNHMGKLYKSNNPVGAEEPAPSENLDWYELIRTS